MIPDIEAMIRAIAERSMRLAVFDEDLRRQAGQWTLRTPIPVQTAVTQCGAHDALVDDSGRIRIPLHEPTSAALTDEYVIVDPTTSPACIAYYDLGRQAIREVPLEEFSGVYPAWRVRYWTGAYAIEEDPPFVHAYGGDREIDATDAGIVSGGTTLELETFFEAVRSALVARQNAVREEARTAFSNLSPRAFLADRGGITDLRMGARKIDDFGQQMIGLAIPAGHTLSGMDATTLGDSTGLHAGDEVIVDADVDALPVEAELFRIGDGELDLGIYWDSARGRSAEDAFDADKDVTFTVAKLLDGRRFDAIESAVDTVARTERTAEIYSGRGELSFASDPPHMETHELDRYQQRAVLRATTAEHLICIEAPPWTGSRRTIWHIVRHAVGSGRRIALITPDVRALNSLLGDGRHTTILDRADLAGIDLTVYGGPESDGESSVNADVVVTPLAYADRLDDHGFDLVVVDQAARIDVPGGAVAFAKGDRVILVGDPMQSPRSRIDRQLDTPLAPSIYEHVTDAYGAASLERLRCQYMMHQAIAGFPNQLFYGGKLIHGSRNRAWSIDAMPALEAVHVMGTETHTPTGSVFNQAEVDVIVEEVHALLDRGVQPDDIGVITPYSAQVGKIRVGLDALRTELSERVLVGNLDRFRCRSRSVVICSTVRTGNWAEDPAHPFWTARGLNVALTRAAKRAVIVGDWESLRDRRSQFGDDDPYVQFATFLATRGLLPPEVE